MLSKLVQISKKSDKFYQPVFFRIYNENERTDFEQLLASKELIVYDEIYDQLKELIKSRNPKRKLTADDYKQIINDHVGTGPIEEYGVWVYYPWSGRVVHLLDEAEFIELRTCANKNKITIAEQKILAGKKVGVIGLSVGQSVSLTLAMERGCGELRIADFDTLELNNLNRIRTGVHNLGLLKAYSVAREIAELDPYFKVICYTEGITQGNIHDFFMEGGKLDAVIDECDGVNIKILCRIKAKELHVPVIMEASDRGTLDIERFDLEPGRSIIHGWLDHLSIDFEVLNQLKTAEEKLPYILPISGLDNLSSKMKASMVEIEQTITTWPQLATAVTLGGAITADTCRRIFLDEFHDSGRYFIDMEQLVHDKNKPLKDTGKISFSEGITNEEINALIKEVNLADIADQKDHPAEVISELVKAAIMAPSGGNAQPWKWKYVNKRLYLFLNSEYEPKLIDYNNTASLIGLGAATENMVLKAHESGLEVEINKFPLGENSPLVSVFTFPEKAANNNIEPHPADHLVSSIPFRMVNRTITDRQLIEKEALNKLVTVARTVPGGDLRFITSADDISVIAEIIAKADKARIMDKKGHLEFLAETKWTAAEAEETKKGIDINTLDLSASERTGFNIIKNWDVIEQLNKWEGGAGLEKLSKRTANVASAIGLLIMPSYSPANFLEGGRMVERVWLAAEHEKISFQPMSISTFLYARFMREELDSMPKHLQKELKELRKEFERIFSIDNTFAEILLFRVFLSKPATKRSLRTTVDEVLSFS